MGSDNAKPSTKVQRGSLLVPCLDKDCDCSQLVHACEIPNLKPESVAFLSYVVGDVSGLPFSEMNFLPFEADFAKVKATHLLKLVDNSSGRSLEFWIIAKDDQPMAVAVREVDGDGVITPTGFVQFVMRPYCQESCLEAIKDLPIYNPVIH